MQAKRTLTAIAAVAALAALLSAGPASAHTGHGRKIDARVLDTPSKSLESGKAARGSAARWRRRAAASGPMSRRVCVSAQRRAGQPLQPWRCLCGSKSAPRIPTTDIG